MTTLRAELLQRASGPRLLSPLVLAEAAYLIGRQLGPRAEAQRFRSVSDGELVLEILLPEDLDRMAELVDQYVDLPLGGSDASVIALAERHQQAQIATLDRRHFSVVRPNHITAFELLP